MWNPFKQLAARFNQTGSQSHCEPHSGLANQADGTVTIERNQNSSLVGRLLLSGQFACRLCKLRWLSTMTL